MKTRFTTDQCGDVIMQFDNFLGDRISRTFTTHGRYVYEITRTSEHQVCARLATRGDTLTIGGTQDLIDIIRREYRAMRA